MALRLAAARKDNFDEDDAPYGEMGATLLSRQPVTKLPEPQRRPGYAWQIIRERLESRLLQLKNWRYAWWMHWSIIATFFIPRRISWLEPIPNRMWRGAPINDAIIDGTTTLALRQCAAGLYSGLTSASRPWFELEVTTPGEEIDAEAQEWIEDTQEKAYAVLHASNFYTTMAQAFEDVAAFGSSPVLMYEDAEEVIRCYLPCAGEYYLGVGARLKVDTFNRDYTQTVLQIIDMFGVSNCPVQITNLWMQGGGALDTEFAVAHSIEPNFAIDAKDGGAPIKVVPDQFSYREVYWLKGQQTDRPFSVCGFREAPFFVARWSTVSNDAYGRSPCMDALGDGKQIQLETSRKAEFIEKGVRPPMGASPSLKNQPSSIIPGNITYVEASAGNKGFWPLFEPRAEWLPALTADIETVKDRIERALFVDLFLAISNMEGVQPRNELELTQRNVERLQQLGPFIQRFENEFAGPAVRRLLNIMQRRGLLRPLPESLQNRSIKINYISIMKLAQAALESTAMRDVIRTAAEMAAISQTAGLPPPTRIINLDEALRIYARKNNFPAAAIYTPDQVRKADQQRAKEAETQAVLAATPEMVNAAKTASEIQLGPGTGLGALAPRA